MTSRWRCCESMAMYGSAPVLLRFGEDDDGVRRDAGKLRVWSVPAFAGGGVVEVWMEARWRRRLRRGRSRRTAAGNNKERGHEAAQQGGETDGRGLGCRSSLQLPEMEEDGGGNCELR